MDVKAFQQLYDYNFTLNRMLWGYVMQLTESQYTEPVSYGLGSIREQVVHLAGVEQGWFSDLRGVTPSEAERPDACADRAELRACWDTIEADIRAYLATLTDDQLLGYPHAEGDDSFLTLWQILIHVANHGTDHRAQTLRLLKDQGIDTTSQDLVFYLYAQSQKGQASAEDSAA